MRLALALAAVAGPRANRARAAAVRAPLARRPHRVAHRDRRARALQRERSRRASRRRRHAVARRGSEPCSAWGPRSARRRPRTSTAWSSPWWPAAPRSSPSGTTSCGSRCRAATRSCSAPTTRASPTASRPRSAKPEVKVYAEEMKLPFAGDWSVYFPKEDGFMSHNERKYAYQPLKDVKADAIGSAAGGGGRRPRDQDRRRRVGRRGLSRGSGSRARAATRWRRPSRPIRSRRRRSGTATSRSCAAPTTSRSRKARAATRGGSWASPRRTPTC